MRVRNEAISSVYETMKTHYSRVWDYGAKLRKRNWNNTSCIKTTRLNPEDDVRFRRCDICYHSFKVAWKEGCRQILSLDGCFLKTLCGGQLLYAVGGMETIRCFLWLWLWSEVRMVIV